MSEYEQDHEAARRLGYTIGERYRGYGGGIDLVVGAVHHEDWRGDSVIVLGESGASHLVGRVRSHSTPCGTRDRVSA